MMHQRIDPSLSDLADSKSQEISREVGDIVTFANAAESMLQGVRSKVEKLGWESQLLTGEIDTVHSLLNLIERHANRTFALCDEIEVAAGRARAT